MIVSVPLLYSIPARLYFHQDMIIQSIYQYLVVCHLQSVTCMWLPSSLMVVIPSSMCIACKYCRSREYRKILSIWSIQNQMGTSQCRIHFKFLCFLISSLIYCSSFIFFHYLTPSEMECIFIMSLGYD